MDHEIRPSLKTSWLYLWARSASLVVMQNDWKWYPTDLKLLYSNRQTWHKTTITLLGLVQLVCTLQLNFSFIWCPVLCEKNWTKFSQSTCLMKAVGGGQNPRFVTLNAKFAAKSILSNNWVHWWVHFHKRYKRLAGSVNWLVITYSKSELENRMVASFLFQSPACGWS